MNRNIFQYTLGGEKRFGDPIALHRALVRALLPHDLGETLEYGKAEDGKGQATPQALEYQSHLLDAARKVFEMKPIDPFTGDGFLDDEVWDVIGQFFEWESKKKATVEPSPTSPPPSDLEGTIWDTTSSSGCG